jgi:hypothetical protein
MFIHFPTQNNQQPMEKPLAMLPGQSFLDSKKYNKFFFTSAMLQIKVG